MEWLLHQWEWYRQNVQYTDLGSAVVWIGFCHALRYLVKEHPMFDRWREDERPANEHRATSGDSEGPDESGELENGRPVFDNELGRWLLWWGFTRD